MKSIRYWLSSLFLDWGVRIIPDEYPRSRMHMGLSMGLQIMHEEMNELTESAWAGDEEETMH